jgi:hypothetical protein
LNLNEHCSCLQYPPQYEPCNGDEARAERKEKQIEAALKRENPLYPAFFKQSVWESFRHATNPIRALSNPVEAELPYADLPMETKKCLDQKGLVLPKIGHVVVLNLREAHRRRKHMQAMLQKTKWPFKILQTDRPSSLRSQAFSYRDGWALLEGQLIGLLVCPSTGLAESTCE